MAYAAVVSLKQTIEPLLHPSQSGTPLPNSELEFVHQHACYLQSFLRTISSMQSNTTIDVLERKITDAVHKAEDLIEFHLSDQFLSGSRDESSTLSTFSRELLKVEREIRSLVETAKNKEKHNTEDQQPGKSFAADSVSSATPSIRNIKVVGFENERNELKRSLLEGSPEQHIISVVGMTGIGKTTLVHEVYSDPYIRENFPHSCFVNIGPERQWGETLLNILVQVGFPVFETNKKREYEEFGLHLHQFLFSRKYLIVLDDIWNMQVWDQLRKYLPYRHNGSRIIFTTRLAGVAHDASLNGSLVKIPFLNDEESWNLLRDSVFGAQELCHPELEVIGKRIAETCEGLPLAILAVGSLLQETEKTVEKWKSVAEDENSLIAPISDALSLSYKGLPQHLKTCFLYMGVFPQDYDIPVTQLIQLWVAEGLFEPERNKSLEETAEKCLNDLVSRSLVILGEQSSRGKTKTCRIHFVYRILCVGGARKEKFFHVLKKLPNSFLEGTSTQRRLCFHNNNMLGLKQVHESMELVSAARSLLCFGPKHHHGLQVYLDYKLLKVLDSLKIRFYKFPDEVLKLVQLRYLAITHDGELPESISRLLNLQVLIVRRHQRIKWSDDPVYLPMEIWNLQALRHLECMGLDLPDPWINGEECDSSPTLEELLTLSGVSPHSCTREILARMPNLIKLGIWTDSRHDGVETFVSFGDCTDLYVLESFKWVSVHPYPESKVVFSGPAFSDSLQKITLRGCGFSWEYMTYIGRLPKLEVLKVRCFAFRGPVWVTTEGEFPKLKLLLLEDLDVEQLDVDSDDHFPLLRRLIIKHCYKLRDIPFEFIYMPTLESIEVDDCSRFLMDSVQKLQQIVGARHLPVQIRSSWDDKSRRS